MIEGYQTQPGSPALYGHGAASASSRMAGRQEILARERNMVAAGVRPPRRAQSTNDYVYPTPPPSFFSGRSEPAPSSTTSAASSASSSSPVPPQRPPTIREGVPFSVRPEPEPEVAAETRPAEGPGRHPGAGQLPSRPKMGAPRRSYSVMDYEPVPPTHRPSANLALGDLPPELHFSIFDFLDPIDSTCLGLTNKHFYTIHRRLHGSVPLSTRRKGPNDMEWVWHLACRGLVTPPQPKPTTPTSPDLSSPHPSSPSPSRDADVDKQAPLSSAESEALRSALARLRVRGQALCRKCGVRRCELHTHIQDWMGPGYEYCTVRDKFASPAPAGSKQFCYLSNPKYPHRCGRHRIAGPPPQQLQRSATAPAS